MSNPQRHMEGILRAFAMTPEERLDGLMSSPYWELNQKYAARSEIRNLKRKIDYTREKIALTERKTAMLTAQIEAANAQLAEMQQKVAIAKGEAEKAKHNLLMKNLKANAAIREFTASLRGSVATSTAAKPPIAAPVAPVPSKSAADVLQEMINKKYRLK